MKIAFVGEIDHGKSSLIGRLLLDTKSLTVDKLNELEKISKELGVDACLAFLVDQFIEEREGLLTIDTTQIVLKIRRKSFICIDTPGHLKFLKNMMTGASHADAAVIVIDAQCGVQEQTLLHARILEMFGITSVIFAVNKMDLVDYQEGPFRLIEGDIGVLSKKSGITPQAVVPVSAQYGINILLNSGKTKWYKGISLVPAIDHFKGPLTPAGEPLRFPVQDIYQLEGHPVIVGRLSQGTISQGQKVLISPSMEETQINSIKIFGQERRSARKGENIGLCCSPQINIKRGDVLCNLGDRLLPAHQFQAQVLWLAEGHPKENESVTIQVATQQLPCTVKSIEQTLNAPTFNITFDSVPAAVEPFALTNELGRFMIEKKGRSLGAGIITKILGILILFIPLLWMDAYAPNAFAQKQIENYDPSLDPFVARRINYKRWRPLITPQKTNDQKTNANDLKDLQALTYLQGYNPVPLYKNVTVYDKNRSFPGDNLFLSADAPVATLMDMNGKTVHQWQYPSASLPIDHRYCADYWVRARILKDGDLLALIPLGGLLKIDKKSHLIWFKKIFCHHDFDINGNGDIYTLTVKNSRSDNSAGILIDSITVLSPDGKIKKEISLYDLFKKYHDPAYLNKINALSHMKVFFYGNNDGRTSLSAPREAFHSNSIQVLDGKWGSKVPAFKKGNLLITIRNLGVIICVDPDKEEIVWIMDKAFWNDGEHFAKLLDNGHILLFDNHYRYGLSRVVEFDPVAKKIIWDYSRQYGLFYSPVDGQCYRLPNGNTLITESTNGHSFEVTPDKKIVWEFYNPHQIGENKKLIAMVYQMQRIAKDLP